MSDLMDCGDSSCEFALKRTGMRTNGGCRCLGQRGPGPIPLETYRKIRRHNNAMKALLLAERAALEELRGMAGMAGMASVVHGIKNNRSHGINPELDAATDALLRILEKP